jgi:hypothetical protein
MENNNSIQVSETTEQPIATKTKATGIMPRSQFDVLNLAENAAEKWEQTPQITLLWTNAGEFKKLVSEYKNFLQERVEVGSGRSSQTQTLKNFDSQINKAVEEIKIAIMAKFGKDNGKAYYAEFGIVKQSRHFTIPTDRNQRVSSLLLLSKAINNHKLQVINFDNTFFETIANDYTMALQATQKTDSSISVSVGNKNDLRKQIETILTTLHIVIKANYPNTYEGELRGWGFQKEKY